MARVSTTMEPEVVYEVDQREADEMKNRGYLSESHQDQDEGKTKSKAKAEDKTEDKAQKSEGS